MPLDVARLRDSDLASNETPEACWAAVLLWSASWHQVPAGSIPNDERWIAKQAGYAQRGKIDKEWAKVKDGALRGWVECTDGRLYHPVVAEKARDAWNSKLRQRWKTEAARIKKHNDRHHTTIAIPDFEKWLSFGCPSGQPLFVPRDKPDCPAQVPRETHSKGEGEGEGQGQRQRYTPKGVVVGGSESAHPHPSPGEVCRAMKAAGMANVNPSSPKLVALLKAGITQDELVQAASDAVTAQKPFAYALATAEGRRNDAAKVSISPAKTPNRQAALEQRNRQVADAWATQGETHEAQ